MTFNQPEAELDYREESDRGLSDLGLVVTIAIFISLSAQAFFAW